MREFWDSKKKDACGFGIEIKGVDREKWITFSKIAVPLEVCSACVLAISSEDRKYDERSTENSDDKFGGVPCGVAYACLFPLQLPSAYGGNCDVTQLLFSAIYQAQHAVAYVFQAQSMTMSKAGSKQKWMEVKSSKCWPQEYEPGVRVHFEALWLLAIGDEPLLGFGNPFWTKAGLFYAMAFNCGYERIKEMMMGRAFLGLYLQVVPGSIQKPGRLTARQLLGREKEQRAAG